MIPPYKIFCELDFWKACSILRDSDDLNCEKHWCNLFFSLCESDVVFDCSDKVFMEHTIYDSQLKRLWKRSVNGECKLNFKKDYVTANAFENETFFNTHYNTIYFSKDPIQIDLSKYGILNICANDFEKYDSKEEYIESKGDNIISWRNYKEHITHPCNSIILIDNFILKNEKIIRTEFLDLMRLLIPSNISVPLHIFIITKEERFPIKNMYEKAYNCIKQKYPSIEFSLTIYNSNFFHDRHIITNNAYIFCGKGFDALEGDASNKPTTVSQYFFCYNAEKYKKIVCKILKNVQKVVSTTIFEGSKNNRLL